MLYRGRLQTMKVVNRFAKEGGSVGVEVAEKKQLAEKRLERKTQGAIVVN